MAEQQYDRRSFPRVPVQARMRVSHSRLGTLEGYSLNVSDTGIFLRLHNLPKVPRGAHIGLQMLDSANPGIIFNTRVIHSSVDGLGVAIVDYELNGMRYTLDELRRQWAVSKSDIPFEHTRGGAAHT
ncbi:MAG: PilZ domain-containing protein [Thioalkalispiraceae bacterium]